MDDSLEKINDDEVSLPKATVDKIIIESLSGKLASKEVKETVMRCAVEYIHLITSEANETCERESRKTITHEHIFKALNSLGYGSYIKECEEVLVEHTTLSKMKPSKTNKFKDSGLTMDELYEQQLKLFEAARKNPVDENEEKEENKS